MSGQSKAEFSHFVKSDPEINTEDNEIPRVVIAKEDFMVDVEEETTHIIIDAAVWFRCITDSGSQNANECVQMMGSCLKGMLRRKKMQVLAFCMDKEGVIDGKGATQMKRKDQQQGKSKSAQRAIEELEFCADILEADRRARLPVKVADLLPSDMTVEQAAKAGLLDEKHYAKVMKPENDRKQSLQSHKEKAREHDRLLNATTSRLSMLNYAQLESVLPYFVDSPDKEGFNIAQKAMSAISNTPIPMPWNYWLSCGNARHIIMMYFCLAWALCYNAHLCPRLGTKLLVDGHRVVPDNFPSSGIERVLNPRKDHYFENVPLMYSHPNAARPEGKDYGKNAESTANEDGTVTRSLFDIVAKPISPYPIVTYAEEYANTTGEGDHTLLFYTRKFALQDTRGVAVIELVSRDTDLLNLALLFLFKWQHNLFAEQTSHLKLPKILLTTGSGWSNAGQKSGSINVTAAYLRIIKYKFGGDPRGIPDLIASLLSSVSDYTLGYSGIPMPHFYNAFFKYRQIRAKDHGIDYDGLYLQGLVRITNPIRNENGDIIQPGSIALSGRIYRRLIKVVFAEKYESRLKALEIGSAVPLSMEMVRSIVNDSTKKKYRAYWDNPENNPHIPSVFETFLAAHGRCLPPDEEIANRALLVNYAMIFLFQIGEDVMIQPDSLMHGYQLIDASKPRSRHNIEPRASIDYQNRRHHFNSLQKRMTILQEHKELLYQMEYD